MWQALASHHLCFLPIKCNTEKGSDQKGMHIYQTYFEKKVTNTNIVRGTAEVKRFQFNTYMHHRILSKGSNA